MIGRLARRVATELYALHRTARVSAHAGDDPSRERESRSFQVMNFIAHQNL